MAKPVLEAIVQTLGAQYKYYHGWHFNYEHPGALVYTQMGGGYSIYFTPDWNEDGMVAIQVVDADGAVVQDEEVSYQDLGAYELFRIVKPFLDRYGG